MTTEFDGATDVVVVGAGIVGTCIAYALRKRGHDVVLVDRDEPGRGCSFGNSGAISPGSVAPLGMPGVIASTPAMLLDRESPLYLPLRYLPRALPWLIRFIASARPARVQLSSERLAALHAGAVERHEVLTREIGVPELLLRRGHLHLYPDGAALKKDAASWRLRAAHGYPFERLDRSGILALEPDTPACYRIGMFLPDHATIINPYRYVQAIARAFVAAGGHLAQADITGLKRVENDGWQVESQAGTVSCKDVVVAAGAWSRRLLDPLDVRLPIEAQRGYHVQFRGAAPITRTVVLADCKVFATPMEEGLRLGGTVEIGGLASPPSQHRVALLMKIAREAFPGLDETGATTWMGHRPCMPDSIPVIGRIAAQPGMMLAVGHGHLGLTDSVNTAEQIAEMMGHG